MFPSKACYGAVYLLALAVLSVSIPTHSQLAPAPASAPAESKEAEVEARDEIETSPPSIQEAPEGRFSYMCSLRKRGTRQHICGGTLVDHEWVVTAAHCIDPYVTGTVGLSPIVYCGIHDVNSDVDDLTFAAVDSVIHEQWTGSAADGYDIALVKLERAANLSMPSLNLPGNPLDMNSLLSALGWGKTRTEPNPQKLLIKGRLNHVSFRTCNDRWAGIIKEDIMLCAGIGERDTCRGDGGGPLLLLDEPRGDVVNGEPRLDLLVGLTSFGSDDCGHGTRPGVYTNVGFFSDWIKSKTSPDDDEEESEG